jgi:hypothetical protein
MRQLKQLVTASELKKKDGSPELNWWGIAECLLLFALLGASLRIAGPPFSP